MISQAFSGPFVRTLQLKEAGAEGLRDIIVQISLPEPDPLPGGDYRVLLQIEGFAQPYSRHFHGVDELQAFLAACWVLPAVLGTLAPSGAELTWLGEQDLGFIPP